MFKNIIALACAGALAGCAGGSAQIAGNVSAIVATAIADAQKICSFVPDAEAIGQLAAAGDPLLATGSEIANAFCNAIQAQSPAAFAARRSAARAPASGSVTIDGIVIPFHSP